VSDEDRENREELQRAEARAEIARIVAAAASEGRALVTGPHVAKLQAAYPDTGWSTRRLIDELVLTAITAGLPIQITRPKS
jgi:hypothetical protein